MITQLSLYAAAEKPKPKKGAPQKKAVPVAAAPPPTADDSVDPELLAKINALFDAIDFDGDNTVSKLEMIEFLRECKPKDLTVAKIQVSVRRESE
jgi:hypothetical protein